MNHFQTVQGHCASCQKKVWSCNKWQVSVWQTSSNCFTSSADAHRVTDQTIGWPAAASLGWQCRCSMVNDTWLVNAHNNNSNDRYHQHHYSCYCCCCKSWPHRRLDDMCLFKPPSRTKLRWQMLQVNGFSPVCDRTWTLRSADEKNVRWQVGHVYGRSFVCTLITCCFKLPDWTNCFSQTRHLNGCSPVCVRWWTFMFDDDVNVRPHTSQLKRRSPACTTDMCLVKFAGCENRHWQTPPANGRSPVWIRMWRFTWCDWNCLLHTGHVNPFLSACTSSQRLDGWEVLSGKDSLAAFAANTLPSFFTFCTSRSHPVHIRHTFVGFSESSISPICLQSPTRSYRSQFWRYHWQSVS